MRYFRFNKQYFILTIVLLIIEILIGKYLQDRIIRPYIGDVLVVILIYCFVLSFFNFKKFPTAITVLIFAFMVEISQYFHLVKILGWENNKLARTIIGTSFSWQDLIAYIIGIMVVLIQEYGFAKDKKSIFKL
jgi:hypothetical protein